MEIHKKNQEKAAYFEHWTDQDDAKLEKMDRRYFSLRDT